MKQKTSKQKLSKSDQAFLGKHRLEISKAENKPSKYTQDILQFCRGSFDDIQISFLQGFLHSSKIKTKHAAAKAYSEIPVIDTTGRLTKPQFNASRLGNILGDPDDLTYWIWVGYFAGLEVKDEVL